MGKTLGVSPGAGTARQPTAPVTALGSNRAAGGAARSLKTVRHRPGGMQGIGRPPGGSRHCAVPPQVARRTRVGAERPQGGRRCTASWRVPDGRTASAACGIHLGRWGGPGGGPGGGARRASQEPTAAAAGRCSRCTPEQNGACPDRARASPGAFGTE